ncbi:hypothetical protein DIPPA_16929 [Diplonema papillatum]|nr:hypothetical protein DIPPA_16929 [Diplonema papillatum]
MTVVPSWTAATATPSPPSGTQFVSFGIDTQPTPCRSLGSEAACLAPPVGGKCSWDHDDGVCVLRFFEPGVPFAGPSLCTPRCSSAAFKKKQRKATQGVACAFSPPHLFYVQDTKCP